MFFCVKLLENLCYTQLHRLNSFQSSLLQLNGSSFDSKNLSTRKAFPLKKKQIDSSSFVKIVIVWTNLLESLKHILIRYMITFFNGVCFRTLSEYTHELSHSVSLDQIISLSLRTTSFLFGCFIYCNRVFDSSWT
jgi:hypothetical protein